MKSNETLQYKLFTSVYVVQYNINWCKQVRPILPWKKLGGWARFGGPVPPWPQRRAGQEVTPISATSIQCHMNYKTPHIYTA